MGDLPIGDLERGGERVLAWIAQYLTEPQRHRVLPSVAPGEITSRLPATPPVSAERLDDILDDFERVIVPGISHWNHPAFFAYFATSSSIPGILAESLVAALDVKAMLWKTSPAATELEQVVTGWLRQMLGLDEQWFGLTTDTASMSSMLALAAAREARPELAVRQKGLAGRADLPVLRVYASEHAHSSIDKAALALGFGLDNVVKIAVDGEFRMIPQALERAIDADRRAGRLPVACVATVGTTSSSSVDPTAAIAEICRANDMWLHVDGAYAGIAAIADDRRSVLDGVDGADSLVVNPHKWMFTPFDCSVLYLRRPEILKRAFSLVPEYLVTREQDDVVNYMDYGVQLGRRFRALKLWMVIRAFGVEGIADRIRAHCGLARAFEAWVRAEPDWCVVAPVPFALVCFRYAPPELSLADQDALNQRILDAVNDSGDVFLSHTKLDGRFVLRLSVGNIRTEERHVRMAWDRLREAALSSRA